MKKILMLLVTLTALCAVSCKIDPEPSPGPSLKPTVTSNIGKINGKTNVNPKDIQYIDITYDEPMNSNFFDFIYYKSSADDIYSCGWINDFTFRFYVNLSYDINFNIVINDSSYTGENWNPKEVFWRNKNGTFAEETVISFNTIPYPRKEPMKHFIDFTDSTTVNLGSMKTIKLQPNNYDANGNFTDTPVTQQLTVGIRTLLNNELLLPGDTLTLKYKLSSLYDISNVKTNLIDNSKTATWLDLSSDKDQLLAPDYTPNEIYEGSLKFKITEQMQRGAAIQIFASYTDTPEDVSIDFIQ